MMHRLAESGLRVPACASLLSGMETSPSQGVEVPMLADQDLEDMFLADTQARLGRVTLRGTTMLPFYHLPSDTKTIHHSHNDCEINVLEYFTRCILPGPRNGRKLECRL